MTLIIKTIQGYDHPRCKLQCLSEIQHVYTNISENLPTWNKTIIFPNAASALGLCVIEF